MSNKTFVGNQTLASYKKRHYGPQKGLLVKEITVWNL